MTESAEAIKSRLLSYQIRERIAAIVCLTAIAMVAVMKLADPENIIINIVVAIAGFMAGGGGTRQAERSNNN